jgi:hypothetical protein
VSIQGVPIVEGQKSSIDCGFEVASKNPLGRYFELCGGFRSTFINDRRLCVDTASDLKLFSASLVSLVGSVAVIDTIDSGQRTGLQCYRMPVVFS